jgi:hypothetical protein
MVFTLNSPALDFLSEVIGVEGSGGVSRSALEKYRPAIRPSTEDTLLRFSAIGKCVGICHERDPTHAGHATLHQIPRLR